MRTLNQEISLKIKPKDNNSLSLYSASNQIYSEIQNFIEEKYPNEFNIDLKEKFGINYFTNKLKKNENFSFVKYGDGELLCMIGGKGANTDHHPYSEKLGNLLKQSFVKLLRFFDDVYLAEWDDNLIKTRDSYLQLNDLTAKFADYECFLTVEDNIKDDRLLNFYKLLKNSKRKKIFVGPKKLIETKKMLDIDEYLEVPIIDAFSEYENLLNNLKELGVNDNNIYIFCCSMMSCVLCSDLKEINPNITLLDIGSGLDPIFAEKTRPKQPPAIKCYEYFREILSKDYLFDKKQHAINQLNKICSAY